MEIARQEVGETMRCCFDKKVSEMRLFSIISHLFDGKHQKFAGDRATLADVST